MDLSIISTAEAAALNELIDSSQHIVITAHKSPDGDALGSSLGLADYLRAQRGKEPSVIVPDAYPDFLHWLPNCERIIRYDKHPDEVKAMMSEADLVFCVDYNDAARLEAMAPLLTASTAHKVMIDHHLNPSVEGLDIVVSHPDACSASELMFRIIYQLGGFELMSKKCAAQLYCGMMTDTGGFTFNSSRPEIFDIIGKLLTKGIDKDRIYRNVYNNYSVWAIRLRGYVMSRKLNYFEELHASYFTITRSDMHNFHFIKGDAEGLVNEPLRIKGMKLSISLREDDRIDNLVWVSLRSVDTFPCNEMAARFFGGGGHLNASGGRLNCSIAEAEDVVRRALLSYSELLKA